MGNSKILSDLGLSDARAPRYTSYPTAVHFKPDIVAGFLSTCLQELDPEVPVSMYLHIPFCERLCWFCACRTQGTKTLAPVESYLKTLIREIEMVAAKMPKGVRIGRLHWGGGTPTILPPAQITALTNALKKRIGFDDDLEFSVEIDPTLVDADKVNALAEAGMTRASIGIQDFAPQVQKAIGREQSYDQTAKCVSLLRDTGITSLNADIVYGLPHQTTPSVLKSLDQVLSLAPDRIALFGYAHVPWMAKRQRLIDATTLPDARLRLELFAKMSEDIQARDYQAIGIDHFAKPQDTLAEAARSGALKRNFQGYTDDRCPSLIGLGASSISKFSRGYAQNAAASSAYVKAIQSGTLATARGYRLKGDDKLRARTIEMLMCDFMIDLDNLKSEFGASADAIAPDCIATAKKFDPYVTFDGTRLRITAAGRPATRIIAQDFDRTESDAALYSAAS
jgi:oxygen-independent coproporphyrinogen III oxidase